MNPEDKHRFTSAHDWAGFVFDRKVAEKTLEAWYWDLDVYGLLFDTRETLKYAAETFENAPRSLARFSDGQLAQGLSYIMSNACSSHLTGLSDESLPVVERIRAVRSFIPLFRDTVATRHSEKLGHTDEDVADVFTSVCYMWWDVLPIGPREDLAERAALDAAVLDTLRTLLLTPHDGVRENALHGLNEWCHGYPDEVAAIVDEFLRSTPDLSPELAAYAAGAREGMLL